MDVSNPFSGFNLLFPLLERKTLILDLDETLIHCVQPNEPQVCDIKLPVVFPTGETV